jgi:hypothetical protein
MSFHQIAEAIQKHISDFTIFMPDYRQAIGQLAGY